MDVLSLNLLQDHESARRIGSAVGNITAALVLLVGIIKCLIMIPRPTVSRKCIVSLTVVLVGWWIGMAVPSLVEYLPAVAPLVLPVRLLSVALFAGGVILAILGLVELKSRKGSDPVQGKAQAVWAIVIVSLFGLLFAVAFVAKAVAGSR